MAPVTFAAILPRRALCLDPPGRARWHRRAPGWPAAPGAIPYATPILASWAAPRAAPPSRVPH